VLSRCARNDEKVPELAMCAMIASGRRTAAQVAGGEAEEAAAGFLVRHGLRIIARNYRTRLGEIDLIARDGATLVFVEVRLRSSEAFGGAAGSIGPRKQQRIASAARQYLARLGSEPACRFDVVTLEDRETTWMRGAFELR
jgi:putative endonuclease